jgi:hypothetical protein
MWNTYVRRAIAAFEHYDPRRLRSDEPSYL